MGFPYFSRDISLYNFHGKGMSVWFLLVFPSVTLINTVFMVIYSVLSKFVIGNGNNVHFWEEIPRRQFCSKSYSVGLLVPTSIVSFFFVFIFYYLNINPSFPIKTMKT